MKKNFSKALAGTLTVAMVLGMAAPAAGTTAQAYAKNGIKTKYSAIYAGKTKTYTLKTAKKNTKWSVTGEGKQYVTLSAKKGKSVKATIAKDAPAGVKATVVAKLKKGKKYKKVDADKFTIKVDATAVAVEGNGEVKTGSTATYTAKTTPAKTTNHVYFTVTDKNGNATTGATMNATSGVLTANAAGEYKVNVATARGDKQAAEGKFTANASMDVKVTDPVAPEAKLTAVKQTEAKKFTLTFDSELKEIKTDEVTMVNDSDKTTKVIKSVAIGADKKTVTLETLIDVMDGKSYTVTYKGSTAQFTATDGVVADFSLNTDKFQVKKAQELKVNCLDKNQVIIKTIDVKESSVTDGKYTITTSNDDGYFKDDKLVMQTVGKTETVEATWHSEKYNATSGAEEGNVTKKFTITAVAQASLKGTYEKATISENKPADWDKATCSLQLPIGNKKDNKLWVKLNDVEGVETINGVAYDEDLKITCTSSNEEILLVSADADKVELTGVKAGTAYVQIKQDGVTKLTVPVTVVAASSLTNVVLNNSSKTLSNASAVQEDVTIEASTHKDQYNKDRDDYKVSVNQKSKPDGAEWLTQTVETKKVKFQATKDAKVGTYEYELVFKDTDTDKEVKKTVKIKVETPKYSANPTLKVVSSDDSKDVKVGKDAKYEDATVDVKLAAYYDGVLAAYIPVSKVAISTPELKKNGSVESNAFVTTPSIKVGKIGYDAEKGFVKFGAKQAVTGYESTKYVDKAGTGSYVVTFKAKKTAISKALKEELDGVTYDGGKEPVAYATGDTEEKFTKNFTIKDTEPALTITQTKNNVDASGAEAAIKAACEVTYDGTTFAKAGEFKSEKVVIECTKDGKVVASKDAQFYKNGKVYNIKKLNIYVNTHADGYGDKESAVYVKFEKSPGFSITVND